MKKIFTFLLIYIFHISFDGRINAQVSYNFTALTGTYTPITGGTVPTLINPDSTKYATSDEGFANRVPIGFTFIFNGIAYDSININANGFITLGAGLEEDPNEDYFFNDLKGGPSSQLSARPVIAPLWADLDLAVDENLTYILTGVAPNRVLTVQWANAYWDYTASDPAVSFQVKLYETTNVIEFVYENEGGEPTATGSIGLTGVRTGSGNFISLSNSSASPAISTTGDSSIITSPATNQVYRFTPFACTAPSITSLSDVNATSATFSWNSVAGAAGYEYASATNSTPPASGTSTTSDTVDINGLTQGVNNYLFVRTACGGGSFSAWTTKVLVPCVTNTLPADGDTVSKPPTISWNAVTGATGYTVMFSANDTDYVNIGTVGDTTSAQISGLNYNSTYYFYVRPVVGNDTASISCQSNATSFVTSSPPVIPCTTNTLPADGAINVDIPTPISFNSIPDATGYTVMLSSDGGATYDNLGTISDTFALLPPLNFNTTYYYYVRPIIGEDTASTSCQSNATSFTTPAPPPVPANDSCGAAISLIPGDAEVSGTTFSSTPSPDNNLCPEPAGIDPSDPDDDVWYKFTAVNSGSATITVTGVPYFDAVLTVYSGTCDNLTLVDCADNTLDGEAEIVTIDSLRTGQTYYARVYDYFTANPGNFTISVTGNALPVAMGELRAKHEEASNILTWATQTELNNKGFEVQRSADGNDFNTLAFISSKAPEGNSSSILNYTYADVNPLNGNSFYRLKQSDKDGKFVYSNVVNLKGGNTTQLQLSNLYPNPSKSVLNMVITSPFNKNVTIVITDLAGKTVMRQNSWLVDGNNLLKINTAKLSAGSYLIKAMCADGCATLVKKFVKR